MTVKFGTQKSIIVLIDPDKVSMSDLDLLLQYEDVPFCWFIGGSLLFDDKLDEIVNYMKAHSSKPVVLFPGNNLQVSKNADALLFLSLLSGRNPEFLIGQHVIAAPKIKNIGLQSIPTGYILIDGGAETAVSYISNTKPIPKDKPEIAVATAMAAELLGKQIIYLEAGSGAIHSVPAQTITQVKQAVGLPLIVGGGVRDITALKNLLDAGADHVVIGNQLESNPDFLKEIREFFR